MKLVLTIAIGDTYKNIASITSPRMSRYAERIGADFIIHNKQQIFKIYPHYEKFIIHEYLDFYDRLIFLDVDTIVRHDCSNMFELVPEDKLGMYNEGGPADAMERQHHRDTMEQAFRQHFKEDLPSNWGPDFYNSGVIVASKQHQDLFIPPNHEMYGHYWDQSYLNAIIYKQKPEMFDLGYKLNRMEYMDRKLNEDRSRSYIIHYAGIQEIAGIIRKDLAIWEVFERNPNIFI